MYHIIISSLLLAFLSAGCSNAKPSAAYQPEWIYKPNLNNVTGAVGSSKPQFKGGVTAQRRVAISRALDELAQQRGVEVANIIMRQESSSAYSAKTSTNMSSTQKTKAVTINAHIEEIWTDKRTKELFVWLIAD
jgi:hypothetical protein